MPPALNPTGPPKPRPIQRKISAAAKDAAASTSSPKTQLQPSQSMGPPPDPVPPPPRGILAPESAALADCLKSAVVKTAQVYRFHADTKRLGIHRYAPYPPRTLVSSLGRDIEKYDRLCDAIQSNLNRAITVLKRDLLREQNRIKAAEAEAAEKAAAAAAPPAPSTPTFSPTLDPDSGTLSPSAARVPTPRRQSTISLSSLSRPPFPHKLDLSSVGFTLNSDDPILQSGLPSPVTLAPKSSISKVPPDFTFGPDPDQIDLTLDGSLSEGVDPNMPPDGHIADSALGSSADKPIELDLEDFFADTGAGQFNMGDGVAIKTEESIDLDIFNLPHNPEDDAMKNISASTKPPPPLPSADNFTDQAQAFSGMLENPGHQAGPLGQPPPPPEQFDFTLDIFGDGDVQFFGGSNPSGTT